MTAGLYDLKPWFGRRLGAPVRVLSARGTSPDAVTAAGVAAAGGAGLVLAAAPPGAWAAGAVAALLVLRLACANVDGQLARRRVRDPLAQRRGALVNELGDRVADLLPVLALAGAGAPAALVAAAAVGSSAPSWVSLAARSAGVERRLQTGPLGKTERCVLAVVAAGVAGAAPVVCVVLAAGGLLTAAVRLAQAWR